MWLAQGSRLRWFGPFTRGGGVSFGRCQGDWGLVAFGSRLNFNASLTAVDKLSTPEPKFVISLIVNLGYKEIPRSSQNGFFVMRGLLY